jgi:beta-glucanase (GH16 family)
MPHKAILFLCFSALSLGSNLLVNGDFESGTVKGQFTNGYPDGWNGWGGNGWHHSDVGYRRGVYGIAIWSNDTGCIQTIAASAGQVFEVSGEMIYSTSERLVNKNAIIKIEFWSSSKLAETIIGTLTPSQTAGTWYLYSQSVMAPAGTVQARVICQTVTTGGTSTGKAFWDTISVEDGQTINDPDYDDNHSINYADFSRLAGAWQEESPPYNLSGTNLIDLDDLAVMAAAWLETIPQYPGYALVWSDEFEGTSLNTTNWSYQIMGDGGNNELQYYTSRPQNSWVSGGFLTIQANRETYSAGGTTYQFTSARVRTAGKHDFLYGKIEARLKVPTGQGMWPAFWMMPTDGVYGGWAASGEIDIMETNNETDFIQGTLFYGGTWPNHVNTYSIYQPGGVDFSDDFHVFTLEWEPDMMKWYVDGIHYSTKISMQWYSDAAPENERAPFDQEFHILLNIAVGGNYTGCTSPSCITAVFPQQMVVDWVRVYQKTSP